MCIFCERAQSQLASGALTPAQKREVEECEKMRDQRIPATILTGFLGSGKTTFLNYVLKGLHGKRIGVVQNEFGSVSVDDQLMLVERSEAEVVVMPNGCLCCKVRGDLVEALQRLASQSSSGSQEQPLDALIIECSGLSEVLPVAQTFFADATVQAAYRLDGVLCMCDASNFESLLLEGNGAGGAGDAAAGGEEIGRLLREQLAISDVCLLNKCDLVDSAKRDRIKALVEEINRSIKVFPCRNAKVNLGQVLKINSFSLDSVLSLDKHFLDGQEGSLGQGFGHKAPASKRMLSDAFAAGKTEHSHSAFSSLGLEADGEIDLEAFKAWLRGVIEKNGAALLRLKGVLKTAAGSVIVQGVGGHVEIGDSPVDMPAGAGARSRLVLIGRLGSTELRASLETGFPATTVSALAAGLGSTGGAAYEATAKM